MKTELSTKTAWQELVGIVDTILGSDESGLTRETKIIDDLGADSLDMVELVIYVEEAFDVKIDDDLAATWETIGDVMKWLEDNADLSRWAREPMTARSEDALS